MNMMKTVFLMVLMTLLLVVIGKLIGGTGGMIIALVFAFVLNFFSYWFSDKIVLAMYRAKPVSEAEAPRLHRIVERLADRAGLPKPKVCIIPSESPNAFATGRSPRHAVVAITEGALRMLSDEEVEGVLAHELAHVAGRDMLIGTIAAVMAGAIMLLVHIAPFFGGMGGRDDNRGQNIVVLLVLLIFAPIAAMLIQLAVSRSREYHADALGAKFAGNADGLASALLRLQSASQRVPMNAGPATAHLFIVSPLSGKNVSGLFRTHPPIEERVRRLREMVV